MRFGDRLALSVRHKGPLCVGVDPHPALVPALFGPPGPASCEAWSLAVLEQIAGCGVAVVKPQAGLFERWGWKGMKALETVSTRARELGLIVLMDAKRGDIGTTAEGYAEAYLAPGAPFESDAVTVNPYMGVDTLEPFMALAERHDRGVIVLGRTSNPGAAHFQALECDGEPVYIHVARALSPLADRLAGPETGWSGLMVVAGATAPEEARRLRAALPKAQILVPGYGAQGAGLSDALAGFVPFPANVDRAFQKLLEGGVVNASRAVTFPDAAANAESAATWDAAVANAISFAMWDMRARCDIAIEF